MAESERPLILFIDDEAAAVKYFQMGIQSIAPVMTATSVEQGKILLDQNADSLLILVSDQRMPGAYGNEILQYASERYPTMVRILTTAHSEMDDTVQAINQGQIYRYIRKPWDITALRMEMKQALEYAILRKEHAQLLREKLQVLQQQIVANRLGVLQTFCTGLSGDDRSAMIYSYLQAAGSFEMPKPNWLLMDFSDLVAAEAKRNGELMQRLHSAYQQVQTDCAQQNNVLQVLSGHFGVLQGEQCIVLSSEHNFAEYLATPSDHAVSPVHVLWLAGLCVLQQQGFVLQVDRRNGQLVARIEKIGQALPALADLISQLYERNN